MLSGPDHWGDDFPECNQFSQSPVDILTNRAQLDTSLPELTLHGYETVNEEASFQLSNNGHTGY